MNKRPRIQGVPELGGWTASATITSRPIRCLSGLLTSHQLVIKLCVNVSHDGELPASHLWSAAMLNSGDVLGLSHGCLNRVSGLCIYCLQIPSWAVARKIPRWTLVGSVGRWISLSEPFSMYGVAGSATIITEHFQSFQMCGREALS